MAKKLKKLKSNNEVQTNVTLTKNNYGEKEEKTLKGVQTDNENPPISTLPEGKALVGLSKGVTVNLGNYESARINCWITKLSNENDNDIMNTFVELSNMLDEQIQFEVDELKSNYNIEE